MNKKIILSALLLTGLGMSVNTRAISKRELGNLMDNVAEVYVCIEFIKDVLENYHEISQEELPTGGGLDVLERKEKLRRKKTDLIREFNLAYKNGYGGLLKIIQWFCRSDRSRRQGTGALMCPMFEEAKVKAGTELRYKMYNEPQK